MWLLLWTGAMVVIIGVIGGVLGALADRAARPGVTPLGDLWAAFLAGRSTSHPGASSDRVPSQG